MRPIETIKCLKTVSPFRTDEVVVVFTFLKLIYFRKQKGKIEQRNHYSRSTSF